MVIVGMVNPRLLIQSNNFIYGGFYSTIVPREKQGKTGFKKKKLFSTFFLERVLSKVSLNLQSTLPLDSASWNVWLRTCLYGKCTSGPGKQLT